LKKENNFQSSEERNEISQKKVYVKINRKERSKKKEKEG